MNLLIQEEIFADCETERYFLETGFWMTRQQSEAYNNHPAITTLRALQGIVEDLVEVR